MNAGFVSEDWGQGRALDEMNVGETGFEYCGFYINGGF